MQQNRLAFFLPLLRQCYRYPESETEAEILDSLFMNLLTFVPEESYESEKAWKSERANDDHMSPDMVNSVLQDIALPLKWRKICKKITPKDFSLHIKQIIDDIEVELIDETFSSRIKSSKFIHSRFERERIVGLFNSDETKCEFLAAIFLNAAMNSLGAKPQEDFNLDLDLIYSTKEQKKNRSEIRSC